MKAFIDHSLLGKISEEGAISYKNSFLKILETHSSIDGQHVQFEMEWSTFLEYIGLGTLLETLPPFNDKNPFFDFILNTLAKLPEKDILFDLYDQIFVECLSQMKNLPQLDSTFLINQIQNTRESALSSHTWNPFSTSLDRYEKALIMNPKKTIHNLILYLAWDRVCVYLAIIFEHVYQDLRIVKGLEVLKECLIESFQHITKERSTAPSFFRLMEALYAYKMREENLDTHTDAEWSILCEGSNALMPRDRLTDLSYIDAAIVDSDSGELQNSIPLKVFTMDTIKKVQASLSLAKYTIDRMVLEIPDWRYKLCSQEIICLYESGNSLHVNTALLIVR